MNTLAIDSLGLAFAGWIFFGAIVAVILGRVCGLNDRLSQGQREELAERLETDGPFADLTAEREKRVARAKFRHSTRYGRSA